MAKLILTVGLPRSGKTTWSKGQGKPIVNRDSIRLAIHGEAYIQKSEPIVTMFEQVMVESLFLAGHEEVIIDATHTTASRIEAWEKLGHEIGLVIFRTPAGLCIERAYEDGRDDLVPVIERMDREKGFETHSEPVYGDEPVMKKWKGSLK